MTRLKRDLLILSVLHFALAAVLILLATVLAQAQTCTLRQQGYTGSPAPIGLGTVNLRWFTRTPASQIQEFRVFAPWAVGVPSTGYFTASGSALSYTVNYLCPINGGPVTVWEIRTGGSSCSMAYSGNLPHGGCAGNATAGVSVVSSANFRGNVSRGSLVSIFPDPGATFTDRAEVASTFPPPTSLAGVSVEADGQACQIIAVAPGQLNIYLPDTLPTGPTEVSLVVNSLRGSLGRFFGRAQLNPLAVGIFTADATGTGTAAALWLVVDAKGKQSYYGPGRLPGLLASDRVFLILYGTGIHATEAELRLANGRTFAAQFVGKALPFVGLDQLNFQIPVADVWRGEMGATLRVFVSGGYYEGNGFSLR